MWTRALFDDARNLVKRPDLLVRACEKARSSLNFSVSDNQKVLCRPTGLATSKVDIVVCVHNALDDVKTCLESVLAQTHPAWKLVIVDDGSREPCARWLQNFAEQHSTRCTLVRSENATGYPSAANRGIDQTTAPSVLLLNSDTVLGRKSLGKMLRILEVHDDVGIVGPLSNAATWQSVPVRDNENGWVNNSIPDGMSVSELDEQFEHLMPAFLPRVTVLNGFCMLVRRRVFDTIGGFDEVAFAGGYGEENDFCFRATDSGFDLVCALDTYVFHRQSRSYTHQRRKVLESKGGRALREKHGRLRIRRAVSALRHEPLLGEARRSSRQLYGTVDPSIRYYLTIGPGGGGVNSVVNEAGALRKSGVDATVAVSGDRLLSYRASYPKVDRSLFVPVEMSDCAVDIGVATSFDSVELLDRLRRRDPRMLPTYYIQDYEPHFFREGSERARQAEHSFSMIPDIVLCAKSPWVKQCVEGNHDVSVALFPPGVDTEIFRPGHMKSLIRTVVAMVRPSTPRRAARRTMRVLRRLQNDFGLKVCIFGCWNTELCQHDLERDFAFDNRGPLRQDQVAMLLRQADLFVDLSDFQALGLTGLEAMACGALVLMPEAGGASSFIQDGINGYLVDTTNEDSCIRAVSNLVNSPPTKRRSMQLEALTTVRSLSTTRSAYAFYELVRTAWRKP